MSFFHKLMLLGIAMMVFSMAWAGLVGRILLFLGAIVFGIGFYCEKPDDTN